MIYNFYNYGLTFKIKKRELLFYCAWILFLSTLILGSAVFAVENESLQFSFKLIRYFAYVICCLKIISDFTREKIVEIIYILFIFFLSTIGSHTNTMAVYSLILLASIGIDNDKIIKITAKIQFFYLFIIVFLSQIGIIQDFIFDPNGRTRHGLGFSWTTFGPILYFYFCLCVIYTQRRKIKKWQLIVLELGNIWFFYKTNSRLAFTLMSCFLLFILITSIIRQKKRWKLLSKFTCLYITFPFLMMIIAYLSAIFYNPANNVWRNINSLLSGRLALGKSGIERYGISLFGTEIKWIGFSVQNYNSSLAVGYNYVDSSYLQLLLNFGIFLILTVLFIYSYGIYKAIKANDYYLVMIYMCILVFGLTEPRLMNFGYNPFALLSFGVTAKDFIFYYKKHIKIQFQKIKFIS